MQRIIQINICGRVIPIEEDAYLILRDYLVALEKNFAGEEGNDEIIQDIENRISELFTIRLNSGAPSIDRADVQKVIETLGHVSQLNENADPTTSTLPVRYEAKQQQRQQYYQQQEHSSRRLFRNPNDKMLGGVCSGIANYFDIDPVIVRLLFAVLFLTVGIGLLAYILAWIIIPVAKTPEDMRYMSGGVPMDFHTMRRNMGDELQGLKRKGEEMSSELRDFFSKKK